MTDRKQVDKILSLISGFLAQTNSDPSSGLPAKKEDLQLLHDLLRNFESEQVEYSNLRDYVSKYQTIVDSMSEGVLEIDDKGVIQFANYSFCEMTGYESSELLNKKSRDVFLDDQQMEIARQKGELRKDGIADSYELQLRKKNGESIWVQIRGAPLFEESSGLKGSIGLISDITDRKRVEDALQLTQERSDIAARGGGDGLWDWNLITNEVYYSPGWKTILGCQETDIGSNSDEWFIRVHPEDAEKVKETIDKRLNGEGNNFELEHRMLHRDGNYRWVISRGSTVRNPAGKVYRLVGSIVDITEQRINDALTGLPNRILFSDRLQQSLQRTQRVKEYQFSILFLNIDRFKVVNKSLGHTVGDQLIIAVSQRLKSCVTAGDTISRYTGDKFAILLDDIKDLGKPTRVAEHIKEELAEPFYLGGHELFASASIGIILSSERYQKPEQLMRDAEAAMARAQTNLLGYELFDKSMHSRALMMLKFENDLRRAIKRDELVLYYQPIVSVQSSILRGFEALIRWNHPEWGVVSPTDFIPIAEETGLIVSIGEWVLETACKQTRAWMDALGEELFVSVNFSARQFQQKDLLSLISNVLEEVGLPHHCLKMELTESLFMGNEESAIKVLNALKDLGVQISIDDFGTGYSSLSYLKRFPVDSLKIDRAFIKDINNSPSDLAIIYAIINMAHSLKIKVIAEGVEELEQLKVIRMAGCDFMQGFYYGRPLPVEDVPAFIKLKKPLFPSSKPIKQE